MSSEQVKHISLPCKMVRVLMKCVSYAAACFYRVRACTKDPSRAKNTRVKPGSTCKKQLAHLPYMPLKMFGLKAAKF